ncbi:MAG TPA: DUF2442 domain-containing protein [Rhabdochlamydiaceae bacterium]|nr:DUF2442 domain-containing protein [Rhabdochlamydiaceae bacterium]
MNTLANNHDSRVEAVYFTRDSLIVDLKDGRTISAPLRWYPKLMKASAKERCNWQICGGGYGIHWPDLDEDLSTDGLLRGAPAPHPKKSFIQQKSMTKKRRVQKRARLKTSY